MSEGLEHRVGHSAIVLDYDDTWVNREDANVGVFFSGLALKLKQISGRLTGMYVFAQSGGSKFANGVGRESRDDESSSQRYKVDNRSLSIRCLDEVVDHVVSTFDIRLLHQEQSVLRSL